MVVVLLISVDFLPFQRTSAPLCRNRIVPEMKCDRRLCFISQGLRARVLETLVMLVLVALLILGIVWVASALVDNDPASAESLYGRAGLSPRSGAPALTRCPRKPGRDSWCGEPWLIYSVKGSSDTLKKDARVFPTRTVWTRLFRILSFFFWLFGFCSFNSMEAFFSLQTGFAKGLFPVLLF